MASPIKRILASDWTPVLLVWSCLVVLPVGRLVEAPTLIMAISGAILLWRHGRQLAWEGGGRLFTMLFLCIWLPTLLSLPGAVNPERTGSILVGLPRFYLAGLFIVWTINSQIRRERLLILCAALIAFWLIDGLIQAFRGVDLFGFQSPTGRLNALYGEKHIDFGPALATLSPLLLEPIRRRGPWWLTALVFMGLTSVVFLAGSRGGWISFALASLVLFMLHARQIKLPIWKAAMVALVLVAIPLGTLLAIKSDAYSRVDVSLKAFQGNHQSLNEATSGRLDIWGTSLRMIADNPVNGVGVRGYRHAYPDYALAGDPFVDPVKNTGAFYSHQLLLDVTSGAGLIGLAGLILFYAILIKAPLRVTPMALYASLPFLLAAWAWLFPFNSHPNFYSSQWSQLIWWLLALACSPLGEDRRIESA